VGKNNGGGGWKVEKSNVEAVTKKQWIMLLKKKLMIGATVDQLLIKGYMLHRIMSFHKAPRSLRPEMNRLRGGNATFVRWAAVEGSAIKVNMFTFIYLVTQCRTITKTRRRDKNTIPNDYTALPNRH